MSQSIARLPGRVTRPGNRAVLYLRQSVEKDGSESVDIQEHLGREYCERKGYTVVAVETDRISGRKWDTRPGVIATLEHVEQDRADVIVLWKWSRLSRNRLHWAIASDRVDLVGGRIESSTEPLDTTTASGRFARGMMTEYAAFQSEQIGEVWRETFSRRIRQGLPATGRPRLGYTLKDGRYHIDPATAPDVAEMYRQVISGRGIRSLVGWANDRGLRTMRGGRWLHTGLKEFLDHGFAAGLIWHGGQYYPGAHEPIISAEVWDAYIAVRGAVKKPPRGKRTAASGLIYCGGCGAPVSVVSATADGKATYGCTRKRRESGVCPSPVSITRARVEQYLAEWIEELPWRVDELKRSALAAAAARPIEDRDAIMRLISRQEDRLTTLTLRLADEKISQAAYDLATAQVNSQLEDLHARFERASAKPDTELFDLIPKLVNGWSGLDGPAQNRVAHRIIARITVGPRSKDWRDRLSITPVWEA